MFWNFITSYVIAPVDGGIMISHGSLFILGLWLITAKIKRLVRRKTA